MAPVLRKQYILERILKDVDEDKHYRFDGFAEWGCSRGIHAYIENMNKWSLETTQMLIVAGNDILALDMKDYGNNVLHYAIQNEIVTVEMLKWFSSQGCDWG